MSEQNSIPLNNLPIYLQNYTVSVLGNITSGNTTSGNLTSGNTTSGNTTSGNTTSGNLTSGNTTSGICSFLQDPNIKSVGTVKYSTLGIIPSNKKNARVWNLKASGTLKPHHKDYIIHYDLSRVDYTGKVTFENELSGIITVCGQVISISKKNSRWLGCEKTKTVCIIINQSRWGFSITKETPFSIDVQLDDDDSVSVPSLIFNVATNQSQPYEQDPYYLLQIRPNDTTGFPAYNYLTAPTTSMYMSNAASWNLPNGLILYGINKRSFGIVQCSSYSIPQPTQCSPTGCIEATPGQWNGCMAYTSQPMIWFLVDAPTNSNYAVQESNGKKILHYLSPQSSCYKNSTTTLTSFDGYTVGLPASMWGCENISSNTEIVTITPSVPAAVLYPKGTAIIGWNRQYNFPSSYCYQKVTDSTYSLSAFGEDTTQGLYSTFIIFGFNENIKDESKIEIQNLTTHGIRVYGANIDGTNLTPFNNGNSYKCEIEACVTWSDTHVSDSEVDGNSVFSDVSFIDDIMEVALG